MAPKKSQSLLTYLRNQSDYLNARQALSSYAQTFKGIELQFNNTPPSSKNFSEVSRAYRDATTKIDSLQKAFDDAEVAATARFNEEQSKKSEAKTAKKTSTVQGQLDAVIANRDQRFTSQGLPVPQSITDRIAELESQLKGTDVKEEAGANVVETAKNLGGYGDIPLDESGRVYPPVSNISISDYLISVNLGGKEKIQELQTALKAAGPGIYKGPIDGIYRAPDLTRALQAADSEISYYETTGITFKDRLEALQRLATAKTGGEGVTATTTISPLATATTYINAALRQVGIDRDATPEEINSLYKVLNDAENRFKTTVVGGVTRDLLGNRTQFLTNLISTGKYVDPNTGKDIKGLKDKRFKDVREAAKILGTLSKSAQAVKADTRSLSVQSLQSTANANGIVLSPQQLDQYALDIQNGKDIKVIQGQIRNIASAGMPDNVKKLLAEGTDLDTVYAPYKSQMAAILELSPESINFTDPALRSAIGPTGEMSIYDFQKALRKDARWEYTHNAKRDVSNVALKILRDFGFQA